MASTTVTSSGFPPIAFILFFLALIEKGDKNLLSNDNWRAIRAIELAHICNLTGSQTPSTLKCIENEKGKIN